MVHGGRPRRRRATRACASFARRPVVAPEALVEVAVYEGRGRDPRDTAEAWARTSVFAVPITGEVALSGGDDAADARFFSLAPLPPLAFDHARIVRRWLSAGR